MARALRVALLFAVGVQAFVGPSLRSRLVVGKGRGFDGVGVRSTSEGVERATPRGRELAEKLKNVNLYLVGMMGSGKSVVGEAISRQLGSYTFVDTDETIEKAVGSSVGELFASEGEPGFRAVEEQVLGQVAAYVRLVIATGGGIVTTKANWASLRQGIVVWLDVPTDALVARLDGDAERAKRPLLGDRDGLEAKLDAMLEDRASLYGEADVRVSLGGGESAGEVADLVIDDVITFINDNPAKTTPPEA